VNNRVQRLGGVPVSLLTFARENPNDSVSVRDEIIAINRLLERTYPDCTCCVLKAGDFGMPSQWVTVELEITHASLDCLDWYTKQAVARQLTLTDWKPRQTPALDVDLASALIPRGRAS
jgi:hypothetical protein